MGSKRVHDGVSGGSGLVKGGELAMGLGLGCDQDGMATRLKEEGYIIGLGRSHESDCMAGLGECGL